MSFNSLKLDELRKVAETFAVEHETAKNKADLVALLAEEGVSYDMYDKFIQADKAEVEVDERVTKSSPENPGVGQVLVKMERMNPRYDVNEFTFTKDNPFIVMAESKAQEIFDTQQGFRLATPKEAQEFYS
jgi:hypothetical protein